jgi:hypothetical protein
MAKTPKESSADAVRVPFTNTDGQAAFLHFLSLAEAHVAAGKLPRAARDVSVVRVNVSRGVAAVLSREEAIRAKMPSADFASLAEIPALAAALDFAAGRVPVEMSDGEIAALLAEVRPLRKLTLLQLDVFAGLSLVPADRVATIRSGSGPLDSARDAVAIAGVFAEFSGAIAGKHPFTDEQIATLAHLGNTLVRAMTPTAAKEGPATAGSEATLRDAFYGEVIERYEAARELGVIGFGLKELDAQVPPAHARTNAPKKTKKDGTPE